MKICIKMWMKTCFHSHFYTNFYASVTLLFLFGFSWHFHQNLELRNWEWYTAFWEVFAQFLIGKGPIFGPKSGLTKSLHVYQRVRHTGDLNLCPRKCVLRFRTLILPLKCHLLFTSAAYILMYFRILFIMEANTSNGRSRLWSGSILFAR